LNSVVLDFTGVWKEVREGKYMMHYRMLREQGLYRERKKAIRPRYRPLGDFIG
jgi:hypothetical protein